MLKLTRQEQMVLSVTLGLLLVGWAVKAWRESHPSRPAVEPAPQAHAADQFSRRD